MEGFALQSSSKQQLSRELAWLWTGDRVTFLQSVELSLVGKVTQKAGRLSCCKGESGISPLQLLTYGDGWAIGFGQCWRSSVCRTPSLLVSLLSSSQRRLHR